MGGSNYSQRLGKKANQSS